MLLQELELLLKTLAAFRAGQTPEWTHEMRFELSREKPILKLMYWMKRK